MLRSSTPAVWGSPRFALASAVIVGAISHPGSDRECTNIKPSFGWALKMDIPIFLCVRNVAWNIVSAMSGSSGRCRWWTDRLYLNKLKLFASYHWQDQPMINFMNTLHALYQFYICTRTGTRSSSLCRQDLTFGQDLLDNNSCGDTQCSCE